jgi:hypothetical protein
MPGILNEWLGVHLMVAEIYQKQLAEKYPGLLVRQWDNAIQLFRYIERRQLFEQTPTPIDLRMHEALLHELIGLGLILEAGNTDQDLAEFGIGRENLTASIRELEDDFLMWHGPELESARAAELEKTIFGGPT